MAEGGRPARARRRRRRAGGDRGVAERAAEGALDRRATCSSQIMPFREARTDSRCGPEGQRLGTQIRYTQSTQLHRMRVLACAAGGALVEPTCMAMDAGSELDPELRQLAGLARAAKLRGDDNYIMRRGAILHADVAMLAPASMVAPGDVARPSGGLERFRMEISDGQEIDLRQSAVHWELARMLLDFVRPRGKDRADPGHDEMVRQWYRATAAWMQLREDHDKLHLDRARAIFPDDPDILFLSACQRETYAGLPIQTAVRSAILPTGVVLDVGSERVELRVAEAMFRRVLELETRLWRSADALRPCAWRAWEARGSRRRVAPGSRRPHRQPVAVLRVVVPRRRRRGAGQPRRRARRLRTGSQSVADGAVAAAGAQSARAPLRRSQRRAARDRAAVRAVGGGSRRRTTIPGGGITSRRRATRRICSRRCGSRIGRSGSSEARVDDDDRAGADAGGIRRPGPAEPGVLVQDRSRPCRRARHRQRPAGPRPQAGRLRSHRQRRAAGGGSRQLRRGPAQRDPGARHERQRGRGSTRAAARRRRRSAGGVEEGRSGGAGRRSATRCSSARG